MATIVQDNPFDMQPRAAATPGIVGGAMTGGATQGATAAQSTTMPSVPNMAATTFNPQTREVNRATETAAGQVESLLANDNPLLQRARTLAAQGMNKRGLVNSSMSQGAGVSAMIDRITPIAQQDAQTFSNQALANQQVVNQVGQFNAGELNKFGLQKSDQAFTAGENTAQRQFQTGERLGSQTFTAEQNTAQQNFQAAQAALERAHQTSLADKSIEAQKALQTAQQAFQGAESALDRANQKALQESQQTFTATQNQLDRTQQINLQVAAQQFQASESEKSRAAEIMLADKNISAQQALQRAQQEFQGSQSALDRTQQMTLQTAQQNFQSAQSALDRAFQNAQQDKSIAAQQALQTAQQNFTAAQSELDRTQQTSIANIQIQASRDLQTAQQSFTAAQSQLDRDQQVRVTELQDRLNQAGVSRSFAASTALNTSSAINQVLADPNVKPEDKRGAIDNIVSAANSTIQWGSTFYNTTLPTISTPGSVSGPVVTPGPGAGAATSRAPTAADIAAAYREFLGRDPESDAVIQGNLTSGQSLEQIRQNIAQSPEALQRVRFDPAAYLRANPDVAAAGMDPLVHYNQYGRNEGRTW